MAERMGKGGKKQEKKKAGDQASSSSHKAGIVRTHARLLEKKLRHVLKRNGFVSASDYAKTHGLEGTLKRLLSTGR